MSQARRREAIVLMATDPHFARRVRTEPDAVAREHDLDADDMAVLAALRDDASTGSSDVLDARLSKSPLLFGGGAGTAVAHDALGFLCRPASVGFTCNATPVDAGGDGGGGGILCDGKPAGSTGGLTRGETVGLQCNERLAGLQGSASAIQCEPALDVDAASFICDGFRPADAVSFVCDGSVPAEAVSFVCDGMKPAQAVSFVCDGSVPAEAVSFVCDGFKAADAVPSAGEAPMVTQRLIEPVGEHPAPAKPLGG